MKQVEYKEKNEYIKNNLLYIIKWDIYYLDFQFYIISD